MLKEDYIKKIIEVLETLDEKQLRYFLVFAKERFATNN